MLIKNISNSKNCMKTNKYLFDRTLLLADTIFEYFISVKVML